MRILRLDATNEPPDGGSIGDVGTGQAILRLPRVKEANHATEAVEDKGARISLGAEGAQLIIVVDGGFDRLDASSVAKEGLEACVASNGEVGSGTVFEDDTAGLSVAIEQVGVVQELFREDTNDPQLTKLRILGGHPTVALRIHHAR